MATDNCALVRRWFEEVWNARNDAAIDELVEKHSVCHMDEVTLSGPAEFREKMYRPFLAAFPDLKVTVDAVISDGDDSAVRWSAEGTHSGDGLGFPATGEKVTFRGINWIELRDGKFIQGWQNSNITPVLNDLASHAGASA